MRDETAYAQLDRLDTTIRQQFGALGCAFDARDDEVIWQQSQETIAEHKVAWRQWRQSAKDPREAPHVQELMARAAELGPRIRPVAAAFSITGRMVAEAAAQHTPSIGARLRALKFSFFTKEGLLKQALPKVARGLVAATGDVSALLSLGGDLAEVAAEGLTGNWDRLRLAGDPHLMVGRDIRALGDEVVMTIVRSDGPIARAHERGERLDVALREFFVDRAMETRVRYLQWEELGNFRPIERHDANAVYLHDLAPANDLAPTRLLQRVVATEASEAARLTAMRELSLDGTYARYVLTGIQALEERGAGREAIAHVAADHIDGKVRDAARSSLMRMDAASLQAEPMRHRPLPVLETPAMPAPLAHERTAATTACGVVMPARVSGVRTPPALLAPATTTRQPAVIAPVRESGARLIDGPADE